MDQPDEARGRQADDDDMIAITAYIASITP